MTVSLVIAKVSLIYLNFIQKKRISFKARKILKDYLKRMMKKTKNLKRRKNLKKRIFSRHHLFLRLHLNITPNNPFSPDYSSKSLSQSGFDRASNALTNRKQVPDHNYSNSTFGTIPACTNFMVNIPENKMHSEFISSASVSYNPFIIALHNQSYYKEMSETATNKTQKDDKPVSFMQMALQQQNQEIQRIRDEMFAKRLH